MNDKHADLFGKVLLLMLDKSMVGWWPKMSKTGGLPNMLFEPKKPGDLGLMLKNSAEALSGIMVVNDMVQHLEELQHKQFVSKVLGLLDGSEVTQSMAEVLHQVENGNVVEGGWVEADAGFGSIMSSIKLMVRFKVPFT